MSTKLFGVEVDTGCCHKFHMWHETSVQLGWCTEMHMTVNWWFRGHRIGVRWGSCWFKYRWLQGNLQDPSGDEFHGKPCPLPRGHSQPLMVSSGESPELQFQETDTLHPLGLLLFQGDRLMGEGGGMEITPSPNQMPPCTLIDLWSWCFMMEVLIYSLLPGNPPSSFQIYVITQPQ